MGAGHRTIAVPIPRHRRARKLRLGSNSPKRLATTIPAGTSVTATATADEHANCARNGHAVEVGQPGKAQAEDRAGDGQTGRQHNGRDTAVHGVVGRFPVLAGLTRLLISTEEKYPVVGSGRDAEEHQHINGKRREYDKIDMAEEGDDSAGSRQFDANHDQQQNHGDDRPVHDKQHR